MTRFDTHAKILHHPDRLAIWYHTGRCRPITAQLDPTNYCNNKCSFCINSYLRNNDDILKYETMCRLLREMKKLGIKAVNISGGGEPLMNSATPEMIQYAKDIGLQIGFITNGQLINSQIAQVITKNCEWCRISLSATTRKTFKEIRGVDGFDQTLKGIDLLLDIKEKYNTDISLGMNWIYTKKDSWSNLIHFLRNYKPLKQLNYFQILPEQTYQKKKIIAQKDIKEKTDILKKEFPNIVTSKIEYLFMENFGRNYDKCYGIDFFLMIGADGIVYPCCHTLGQYPIGNIYKSNLTDIWYSKRKTNISKSIDVNQCLPMCKHHNINRLLYEIKQPVKDINFL